MNGWMEKLLVGCTAMAIASGGVAQNLVPNGSFEQYINCPFYFNQWDYVEDWFSPYTTSADYFNACAGGSICNVPYNHFGYQFAADGYAYMGLVTYKHGGFPLYREVIAVELIQPLQVGVPVCVSFKAACGGWGSVDYNSAKWRARGPGLNFYVDLPTDWGSYLYPNSGAIHMDTVLADTVSWVTVSGTYVPDSAYRYLAISNFYADSLSWPSVQDTAYGQFGAYSFVDDVRVSTDLAYCTGSVGMHGPGHEMIHPVQNPFYDQLTIRPVGILITDYQVELFDARGRLVRAQVWELSHAELVIKTEDLPGGLYVLKVSSKRGVAFTQHLVHLTN